MTGQQGAQSPLSKAERDALIADHTDYARSLAIKLKREIGADLELAELVSHGTQGLVEAASRYDPSRGAAFTTFAYYRIRGAIFDGLRKSGWLSRAEYGRYQQRANALLENRQERDDSRHSETTEQAVAGVNDALEQLATIFVVSLEAEQEHREVADADAPAPDDLADARQKHRAVRQALAALPEKERTLIEAYYFQDQTLEEAGAGLGLSKSWSSRLHARAIKQLSVLLGEPT
ncbi:MAG: sigma-70 family RNA polymerase sigma factor [Deltaproteobacteria bacterium]|nr:sigma-70 family RNA polymerase sigma factor [Deltaproteobacteria bacterium]